MPGQGHGRVPDALPRRASQVAAAQCGPALRSGVLRDGLSQAMLPGHPSLRDSRDGPEDTHLE